MGVHLIFFDYNFCTKLVGFQFRGHHLLKRGKYDQHLSRMSYHNVDIGIDLYGELVCDGKQEFCGFVCVYGLLGVLHSSILESVRIAGLFSLFD